MSLANTKSRRLKERCTQYTKLRFYESHEGSNPSTSTTHPRKVGKSKAEAERVEAQRIAKIESDKQAKIIAEQQAELQAKKDKEAKELADKLALEEAELSKGDAAKFDDLIKDLEQLKTKYIFKSKKYKDAYKDCITLIDKTINHLISKK